MRKHIKVAITGAAGQIGYALLPRIASGQMFGPDVLVDLHLLERSEAMAALEGVRMELEDCAFPLLHNIVCTDSVRVAMQDVDWALLIGSIPRKAGMERSDLLRGNGGIFITQAQAINECASADVRVLVVGNPCNTNGLIAMHHAPRVPTDRFYAMTALDEKRAMAQLARKANVPVDAVCNMAIWGNHSATQYPDFYHATIDGRPVSEVITDPTWLQNTFIATIQQRGDAIIKARGASSAASAANAVIATVYNLCHDTPRDQWFSVALCSEGQYGVDDGLMFSFPCRVKNNLCKIVTGLEHNAFAQEKLRITLEELRQEREAVKVLGLIA